MSRIGKKPITLPSGVTVTVALPLVTVKGPKGELKVELHRHVAVELADNELTVSVKKPDEKYDRSLWGLSRALLANAIIGVSEGFEKRLEINGVGYKAVAKGQNLELALGYSHPIVHPLPAGISAKVEKNVIIVSGIDKQLVGETAAQIRDYRKPEPYKGKGIKYADEVIRRKAGKVVKAAAG